MNISEIIGVKMTTKSGKTVVPLKYEVSYIGDSYEGEPTAYCNISLTYVEEIKAEDGRVIKNKSYVNDVTFFADKEDIDIKTSLNNIYFKLKHL